MNDSKAIKALSGVNRLIHTFLVVTQRFLLRCYYFEKVGVCLFISQKRVNYLGSAVISNKIQELNKKKITICKALGEDHRWRCNKPQLAEQSQINPKGFLIIIAECHFELIVPFKLYIASVLLQAKTSAAKTTSCFTLSYTILETTFNVIKV